MIQSFSVWIFFLYLKIKFKRDGKWIISYGFIKAITNGFNDSWLKNIKMDKYLTVDINVHYKKLNQFLSIINNHAADIKKDKELTINGYMFTAFPENISLADYLIDEDKKPIDIYQFQIRLKKEIKNLIAELEISKENSELQHGYYHRHIDKILSDTLELYWVFIQIVR